MGVPCTKPGGEDVATKGKPRREGPGALHWWVDRLPGGKWRHGWIAGDTHGLEMHCSRSSKPCVRILTGDDNARCPGCESGLGHRWMGYVPVWRHDGRPMMVIIYEHMEEAVGRLKLHTHIRYGREEGVGESMWIKGEEAGPVWQTTIPEKLKPADLAPSLCTLWRMPELLPWLRKWWAADDTAVSRPLPPLTPRDAAAELNREQDDSLTRQREIIRRAMKVTGPARTEPADAGSVVDEVLNGLHPGPKRKR